MGVGRRVRNYRPSPSLGGFVLDILTFVGSILKRMGMKLHLLLPSVTAEVVKSTSAVYQLFLNSLHNGIY